MKQIAVIMALLLNFSGVMAQKKIVVKNTAGFERNSETVEVKVGKKNTGILSKPFIIKNSEGKEIAYQLSYDKNKQLSAIVFQADVKAKSTTTYYLSSGSPSAVKHLTSANFVPERKDDFAWENDLAAYRMYGPALAKENPSNGVDLWLKRVSDTIVSKRYRDELKNGLSYHIDHGNGLDCYKVGQTLGAGGISPYVDGKLWVGKHFDRYVLHETGPLRSVFTLYYDKVIVGNEFVSQEITITTEAGALLNKAEVTYSGQSNAFKLASGVFLHDGKGHMYQSEKNGIIAYAEDAVTDAKQNVGRNYVGIIFPDKKYEFEKQEMHLLIKSDYKLNTKFTYYFGGGWSKWKFATDQAWFEALEKHFLKIQKPLNVALK